MEVNHALARSPKHSIGDRPRALAYTNMPTVSATKITMFCQSPMVQDQVADQPGPGSGHSG